MVAFKMADKHKIHVETVEKRTVCDTGLAIIVDDALSFLE
jgi:hypothetical protein